VSWKDGFCDGLVKSRMFVPILSRGAINNPKNDRSNFAKLTANSPCDNVLLEHNLALELSTRGLIEKILPIMIGDEKKSEIGLVYGNYFSDGCDPKVGDVVVKSVYTDLVEHLDRLCLGSPLLGELSVAKIKSDILVNQGRFIQNSLEESIQLTVGDVLKMKKTLQRLTASYL
jgi:hypothetical protein